MTTSLDEIVLLSITKESSALTLPGFGTAMILADADEVPGGFTERLRYYTSPSAMLDDEFEDDSRVYQQALVLMSQKPKPERFAIGRRATPVAQSQVFTLPADPDNDVAYSIVINGETITTAVLDSNSTTAELQTALVNAVNAASQPVTAANSGADVIVTADEAGVPFTFSIDTSTTADITAGAAVANVGIPEDLAAIEDEQPDWYCLLLPNRSAGEVLTAAGEIEAMRRVFVAQSNDSTILATPYDSENSDTDIASMLKALGYERTMLIFSSDDDEYKDAAAVGRCLPPIPGSITWKFKQLVGVTADTFTTTQKTNLKSKSCNCYVEIAGRSILEEGTVASGEFMDVTHGIDKLYQRIQELTMGVFLRAPKVPYTQRGLNSLIAPIKAALQESTDAGLIADSRPNTDGDIETPAFSVTAPKIEDIPAQDRESRAIPASHPFVFEATLAGAVHKTRINGTLSF